MGSQRLSVRMNDTDNRKYLARIKPTHFIQLVTKEALKYDILYWKLFAYNASNLRNLLDSKNHNQPTISKSKD